MSRLRARMVIVIATVALLSIATAAPVFGVTNRWAWVVARMPTTASYTPAAMDQGNSLGNTNSIARDGTGMYRVILGGLGTGGAGGGTVHVTALGAQPRFCSVMDWSLVSGAVSVSVRCFDLAGARADSRFVVAFQDTNSVEGKAAYLWADQSMAPPGYYAPEPAYSYNSRPAQTNGVARLGVGRYDVRLGGLGSLRGSVQVSSYGDDAIACRVLAWSPNWDKAQSELVTVRCRDEFGNAADQRFTVTFMQGQGLKGVSTDRSAYLWANQPTTASYNPPQAYRWSTEQTIPTVTRSTVGVYTVLLPGMPRGGAALVTPTGGGRNRCIVGSIRTDAAPQRVVVRCFNVAGTPADAAFTLAYLK